MFMSIRQKTGEVFTCMYCTVLLYSTLTCIFTVLAFQQTFSFFMDTISRQFFEAGIIAWIPRQDISDHIL